MELECKYSGSDSRRMWRGLQEATGYKPKSGDITDTSASLPEDLNNFFARFEAHNLDPVTPVRMSSPVDEEVNLQLTQDNVSKQFKKVNTHKAAGPDGSLPCH